MIKHILTLTLVLAVALSPAAAQKGKGKGKTQEPFVHTLDQKYLTTLLATPGYASTPIEGLTLRDRKKEAKLYWSSFPAPEARIQWRVQNPEKQAYKVIGLLSAPDDTKLQLVSELETIESGFDASKGWDRHILGEVTLPAGESVLELKGQYQQGDIDLRSIEVIPAKEWDAYRARVAEYRAKGAEANFAENIYGVWFTWGVWGFAPDGTQKPWPQQFEDMDWEAWADMVQEMGAAFVIMATSHAQYYMAAPIKSVESITPGRTTIQFGGEDYYMKIAKALNKRGIKLMFYYHHGQGDAKYAQGTKATWYEDLHTKLAEGAEAIDPNAYNKRRAHFDANYRAVIGELGERYGKRLYGWWFDDGNVLYPQNYYEVSWNARKGNPNRILCYNGHKPIFTEYQDFAAGEDKPAFEVTELDENGRIGKGPAKGLMPFYAARAEQKWAVNMKSPKIHIKENYDPMEFANQVLRAAEHGYTMAYSVMMYEDGSISPVTLELLKNAKKALEEKGYERDFAPINQDLD